MSGEVAQRLFADTLFMAALVAAPILLVCLIVGLLVSVFQAVTQIQDMSLVFIPKLLAVGCTAVIAGPWILGKISAYAIQLISSAPSYL